MEETRQIVLDGITNSRLATLGGEPLIQEGPPGHITLDGLFIAPAEMHRTRTFLAWKLRTLWRRSRFSAERIARNRGWRMAL